MKLCSDIPYECYPICDFCKHYNFNGEETGSKHDPVYVDKGCCKLHFMREDPGGGCEYFYCRRII